MALSKEKYDPNEFYQSAELLLTGVPLEDRKLWLVHPCTQALLRKLEGDMCGIVSSWLGGHYASADSIEGTAQLQASARGKAFAIDDVMEEIQEMANPREDD